MLEWWLDGYMFKWGFFNGYVFKWFWVSGYMEGGMKISIGWLCK